MLLGRSMSTPFAQDEYAVGNVLRVPIKNRFATGVRSCRISEKYGNAIRLENCIKMRFSYKCSPRANGLIMLPARVISLETSLDRREHMRKHLDDLGLDHIIVDAVDGRCLSSDQIAEIYDQSAAISRRGRNLSHGEIGCALSHIGLYREIVEKHLDSMMILEDDANVDSSVRSVIENCHKFPVGWDIVFLGCDSRRAILKSVPHRIIMFNEGSELKWALGAGPVTLAHGYIVSAQGASKLLGLTKFIYKPIDYYVGDLKAMNCYVVEPSVIRQMQSQFPSTIMQDRLEQKTTDKQNIEARYWMSRFPVLGHFPVIIKVLSEFRLIATYNKVKLSFGYRINNFYLKFFRRLKENFMVMRKDD